MNEMLVWSDLPKKVYDDYDFTMIGGLVMPVTLDIKAGDTIEWGDSEIKVVIAGRPSALDPEKMTAGEELTIYRQHLCSTHHRVRELVGLNPEQQAAWDKDFKSGKVS